MEWALIRHLYKRPLDTLLATWGISLAMQQSLSHLHRPQGSEPHAARLAAGLLGARRRPGHSHQRHVRARPHGGRHLRHPDRHAQEPLGPAGACHGEQPRHGQRHRHRHQKTDRLTFAIGCGIAGIAGAAFTTIGSTGPTSGSLYIVDAFLVVTFGGAASLLGTVVSAFGIAQTQSITEFFMAGSMAKMLTLSLIVVILMVRPQGLFASKVRR